MSKATHQSVCWAAICISLMLALLIVRPFGQTYLSSTNVLMATFGFYCGYRAGEVNPFASAIRVTAVWGIWGVLLGLLPLFKDFPAHVTFYAAIFACIRRLDFIVSVFVGFRLAQPDCVKALTRKS